MSEIQTDRKLNTSREKSVLCLGMSSLLIFYVFVVNYKMCYEKAFATHSHKLKLQITVKAYFLRTFKAKTNLRRPKLTCYFEEDLFRSKD